jgi:hypothetical protein
MRFLLPLLLVVTIGCGSDDTTQQSETTNTDSQPQPNEDSAKETTAPSDGAISDEQVATLLAQYLGQVEGTALIKGRDGEVQAEFPLTGSCRWLEEGKLIEMRVTEKQPQGDQEVIITKWYDREQQRFLLTRRLASEQATTKPGAYETYDATTSIFHGTVMEGLPTCASWTWTAQFVDQNKIIYTGSFRQDDKVQSTRIDTFERVKPAAEKP